MDLIAKYINWSYTMLAIVGDTLFRSHGQFHQRALVLLSLSEAFDRARSSKAFTQKYCNPSAFNSN